MYWTCSRETGVFYDIFIEIMWGHFSATIDEYSGIKLILSLIHCIKVNNAEKLNKKVISVKSCGLFIRSHRDVENVTIFLLHNHYSLYKSSSDVVFE